MKPVGYKNTPAPDADQRLVCVVSLQELKRRVPHMRASDQQTQAKHNKDCTMTDQQVQATAVTKIFRARHDAENPYFMYVRKTAQDKDLSWEARGVLAYLLSQPNDWETRAKNLERKGFGRDRAKTVLRELESAGYLTRETKQPHGSKGRFASFSYVVHEVPFTEKPSTVEPLTVKPPLTYNRTEQSTEGTEPATQGEVAPHADPPQAEEATVTALEEVQQIPPLVPPTPPIDPLFAFEATQQGLVPAEAQANKKTKGWIYSLVSDFVNGEKRLLKVATLSKEQRAVLAGELPGFLRWYKEQCEGCSYPADVTAHARWVMRWYDAGKPYARIIAPPKRDPNCPDCKGSGLIDLLFNPKTNELVPEREKRWEPGWDRTTTYCTCRLLEGV